MMELLWYFTFAFGNQISYKELVKEHSIHQNHGYFMVLQRFEKFYHPGPFHISKSGTAMNYQLSMVKGQINSHGDVKCLHEKHQKHSHVFSITTDMMTVGKTLPTKRHNVLIIELLLQVEQHCASQGVVFNSKKYLNILILRIYATPASHPSQTRRSNFLSPLKYKNKEPLDNLIHTWASLERKPI